MKEFREINSLLSLEHSETSQLSALKKGNVVFEIIVALHQLQCNSPRYTRMELEEKFRCLA